MGDGERSEPGLIVLMVAALIGAVITGLVVWRLGFGIGVALLATPLGASSLAGLAGAALAVWRPEDDDASRTTVA